MRPKTFRFQGSRYSYFIHPVNNTEQNERIVEIPIIMREYGEAQARILEVGYVISQYFLDAEHDVLDKYCPIEEGVIREDVLSFVPAVKYDLIVSISTFEHVGHLADEGTHDPYKAVQAINRLRLFLAPGGKMVFTIPLGYNRDLDAWLSQSHDLLASAGYMRRVSKDNRWKEVSYFDVQGVKYGEPYNNGNAIMVGVFENAP